MGVFGEFLFIRNKSKERGRRRGTKGRFFGESQRAREQEGKGRVTRKRSRDVVFYRCDSLDSLMYPHIDLLEIVHIFLFNQ